MYPVLTRASRVFRQKGPKPFVLGALSMLAKRGLVPHLERHFERRALVESDLAAICRRDGTFFDHYDAAETFTLDLPTTPYGYSEDELAEMRETYASEIVVDAPYVCELDGVELVGPHAVPLTDGGFVYENALESTPRLVLACLSALARGDAPVRSRFRSPRRISGPLVSLVGPWTDNYTHWHQDYLARLEGLEHFRDETGADPDLLVPADASAWMRDALRAMGYGPDRWVEWHGGRLRVDRFVVSAVRREAVRGQGRRLLYSPTEFRWIRDRVTENVEPERTRPHSSRIYISRDDATVRRVTNEDETMALLSEWGFERYRLADLSYAEQVTLFSDAEAIVSPHGSGLLNQIFADDATVIELFGPKHSVTDPAIEYYLADLLGHDYGCVQCEVVGYDTRVDLDGLEVLLERMLD